MPETEQEKHDLFEKAVEQQAEEFLQSLEKIGMKTTARDQVKAWIKDKIRKGFTTQIIHQAMKSYNYDFQKSGDYLDNMYAQQQKAETAYKEATQIKQELTKEKEEKKKAGQLTWIISAFSIGGVGVFTALFLGSQTKDLGGAGMEMATSMMSNIIKLSWIAAIAGGAVGAFLIVLTAGEYFKNKAKREAELKKLTEAKQRELEAQMKAQQPLNAQPKPQQQPQTQAAQPPSQPQKVI